MRFQNGCNIVAIEHWVMQFWSETILVISNQTHSFTPSPIGQIPNPLGTSTSQNAWVRVSGKPE